MQHVIIGLGKDVVGPTHAAIESRIRSIGKPNAVGDTESPQTAKP
jgi:hypothetical protein